MSFITDKQTLEDLNIPGKFKTNSIFRLFNKVVSAGGVKLLTHMFDHPLSNEQEINDRIKRFQYFTDKKWVFPFKKETLLAAEQYLNEAAGCSRMKITGYVLKKKGRKLMGLPQEYETLQQQLVSMAGFLNQSQQWLLPFKAGLFSNEVKPVLKMFDSSDMSWVSQPVQTELSMKKVVEREFLLKTVHVKAVKNLLQLLYEFDCCIAVTNVALENAFCWPEALPVAAQCLQMQAVRHPSIPKAVANHLTIDQQQNVVFLTGANMAGKSTFMKSVGIAFYLSHMGFPVAAESLRFSVKGGLFTSINVPDSLENGYSHFYAEVLRVKKVAEAVAAGHDLLVIFDELFKGTNVKDAFDATVAVTKGFSHHRNCAYIISTHIIEAAEPLKQYGRHFKFLYLPTVMNGHQPVYTYKLAEGVTADRHGMMIIENENIPAIITAGLEVE